ncbi:MULTISPECIES: DUF2974 domain-containing protein [unclassified Synechocystis]|nr:MULTISPECIES: DUF2974 domain-containing protein [unclassified Synechocystis]ALJ68774.1 lipase [Synechocystis sp. PCC 6803]UOO11144.1 DUF2974 domain-containing protein [Synechocystis sp. PCC 6803]BAM53823.1 hypothetical protein BEST7613_4892 [Synechocystis sp. PCC 6803] [Bacillus subtilis BEST7613]
MGIFNRRRLLLGGVALGGAFTIGREERHRQEIRELQALAKAQAANTDRTSMLNAAFEADAEKIYRGEEIINSVRLTPPILPYDRQISQLLIRCSKIATQQYLTGKTIPSYDGNIRQLPAYSSDLDEYKQIASFRGREAHISESVAVQIPLDNTGDPLDKTWDQAEDSLGETIRQVVKVTQEIPVYLGFILSSPRRNLIVFRGTQTTMEWVNNLRAQQIPFTERRSGQYFGKIHQGFIENYLRIVSPIPREIAQQLDPAVPCYVTGHSLGASLAVLAALDLAVNLPNLRSQIQLYSYACPRVGDVTFAQLHSRQVPNSYRIVNLADVIPLLPPTTGLGTYVHVGQSWSFLSQGGDILPNHVVDTYQGAVDREVETDQSRDYPIAAV